MDWEKTADILKKLIPEIKAQLAENANITIHLGDIVVKQKITQPIDAEKVASLNPEMEDRIIRRVLEKLQPQVDYLDSLSEKEQLQKITDVTSGTIIEADIQETIVFSDSVDAKVIKPDG
jgi:hypothetical protein